MKPMTRRAFPDDVKTYHYSPIDRIPTFQYLYAHRDDEAISVVLKNLDTGEPEKLEFHITGASESPITTVKWIWGKLHTDSPYDYSLTFDYMDGKLVDIYAAAEPKSVLVEVTSKRTKKIRYPAEITTFDIFSPVGQDEDEQTGE